MTHSLFNIKIGDIKGKHLNWNDFSGKKLMIVNVASECGYTAQYTQLEALYQAHQDKLVILGCPCNDFGGQEPGDEHQILEFCQLHFGVSFPMTQKVGILENTHPLYQWLTTQSKNGVGDYEVKWNFHKFLIHPNGKIFASLASGIEPFDDVILDWVKA